MSGRLTAPVVRVARVWLHATTDGRDPYLSGGFPGNPAAMELRL